MRPDRHASGMTQPAEREAWLAELAAPPGVTRDRHAGGMSQREEREAWKAELVAPPGRVARDHASSGTTQPAELGAVHGRTPATDPSRRGRSFREWEVARSVENRTQGIHENR